MIYPSMDRSRLSSLMYPLRIRTSCVAREMMVAIPILTRAATVRALLTMLALFPALAGCGFSGPSGYAEWREGRPSSIAHREAAVLDVDGKLFVFGGFYNGEIKTTDMVE